MSSNRKMTIEEKYEDCCIALNSITKELEVYKKALILASIELGNIETNCRFCPAYCTRYDNPCECAERLRKCFLQKAREQE